MNHDVGSGTVARGQVDNYIIVMIVIGLLAIIIFLFANRAFKFYG